jgi:hypothetical protein
MLTPRALHNFVNGLLKCCPLPGGRKIRKDDRQKAPAWTTSARDGARTKTILFTAHAELGAKTNDKPAVDAFLLKIDSAGLLPPAQELTDMLSLI